MTLRLMLLVSLCMVECSVDRVHAAGPISSSWRRIQSDTLVVVGNAPEGDLRRAFTKIAAFRHAFESMFPGMRVSSGVPTTIVVFKDFDAFSKYQPRDGNGRVQNTAGYVAFQPDANFIVFGQPDGAYPILFHEYAHYLVHINAGFAMPTWLSEGLAEFYSTFEAGYDKGHDVVGRPLGDRTRFLLRGTYIPLGEVVSPRNTEDMWKSIDRIGMFYAESWALVHYLTVERKNPTQTPIGDYLRALAAGASQNEAFTRAFGVDIDTMDRELRSYVRRTTYPGFKIPRSAAATLDARAEPMAQADVHEIQGRILAYHDEFEASDRELKAAIDLDAAHVDARITAASVRVAQDRSSEVVPPLREIVEAAPSNERAWYHLGVALMDTDTGAAVEAFTRGLKINERHPGLWLGLAQAAIAERRDAQARAALAQAEALQGDPRVYRSYAESALRFGRNDIAADAARTFVDRAGFSESSSQYGAFLAAIAFRRLNQPDRADAVLNLVAPSVANGTWQTWVLRFMQKRIDAGAFLAKARSRGEKTEAHAYIGFALVDDARIPDALVHFRWVIENGARGYDEFGMVRNELFRLRRSGALTDGEPKAPTTARDPASLPLVPVKGGRHEPSRDSRPQGIPPQPDRL